MRHSGFSDPEQRYRQRYADLAVHPGSARAVRRALAHDHARSARFLDALGYLEVETPVLQPLYGGARRGRSRRTTTRSTCRCSCASRTSCISSGSIVGGFERVYEIGHDFRNEGIDRTHNPEFTMLEFYEAYADYDEMMDVVERLLVRGGAMRCARCRELSRERGAGVHAAVSAHRVGAVAQRGARRRRR